MALLRVATNAPFRGLAPAPFEDVVDRCGLGKRTLVYGRNGSGKTTLSELLRNPGTTAPTAHVLVAGKGTAVPLTEVPLMVYNRFYVQESLSTFIDGAGLAPSIAVRLGGPEVRIEKQATERELHRKTAIARRLGAVRTSAANLEAEVNRLERGVQDNIIATLKPGDPGRYTSTGFTVARVRPLLSDENIKPLSQTALASATATANAVTFEELAWESAPLDDSDGLRSRLNNGLLVQPIDTKPIATLVVDPKLADWVERGVSLHVADETCKFCHDGVVSKRILETYAQHFSDALNELRTDLKAALFRCEAESAAETEWIGSLPSPKSLVPDLREHYADAVKDARNQVEARRAGLDTAAKRIRERIAEPFVAISPERLPETELPGIDTTEIDAALNSHNEKCAKQDGDRVASRREVERHFAANRHDEYANLKHRIALANNAIEALLTADRRLETEALRLRESMSDTSHMANLLDDDLKSHFGLTHLKISSSSDGKGYSASRGGTSATYLSEGERNALAFAYFLRTLGATGVTASETIVVIDDPSTSLDKEALFSAFALAQERTKDFAQVVILTHDFEYFRLLLNEYRAQRNTSQKKIKDGDLAEKGFPKVQVLEMICTLNDHNERSSHLRVLPDKVIRAASEYHYLFEKVAEAVIDPNSAELPLLGNAARRLIEGFISFRGPNGDNFQSKVDAVASDADIDAALAKRIVKFLHGHSHREEPRPSAALDFPSISEELRSTMEFIKQADYKHFARMCKAVGVDESAIQAISA